jgi:predicted Zn-dependent protease
MAINRRSALQRILALGAAYCGCGCRSMPVTQRKQLLLLPEKQELALGQTAYKEVTSQTPHSTNLHFIEMVNRVGLRIAEAAERPDYAWEFRVLASPAQNAFCLPGGKVAIYEGILPACANEAGLAVVMAHEIAHVLARHGGERMSQNHAVEGVRQTIQYVANKNDLKNRDAVLQAYGVASTGGAILPYSRKHQSEADHAGILLMGQAGYDPGEAPRFWRRFAGARQETKPPEFLVTHPPDERRAQDLEQLVPQAVQLYTQAPNKRGLGVAVANSSAPLRGADLAAWDRSACERPSPPPRADFVASPEPIELPLISSRESYDHLTGARWLR